MAAEIRLHICKDCVKFFSGRQLKGVFVTSLPPIAGSDGVCELCYKEKEAIAMVEIRGKQ